MIKIGKSIAGLFTKTQEYRGIPVGKSSGFVFGNLSIIDDDRNTPISSCAPKKSAIITYYDGMTDWNLGSWKEVPVRFSTIGQKIWEGIYEGDILMHPKYPGVMFEFGFWKTGWVPKVIYGSMGKTFLEQLPQDIEEYLVIPEQKIMDVSWYPQYPNTQRYAEINSEDIFISNFPAYEDMRYDLFFESSLGEYGKLYTIDDEERIEVIGTPDKTNKKWILDKLKERRLIKV